MHDMMCKAIVFLPEKYNTFFVDGDVIFINDGPENDAQSKKTPKEYQLIKLLFEY